jgi:hypothetical protein
LPSLKNGDVRKQLARKFHFVDAGGTRHDRFELEIEGELVAYVVVERHKNDIRDTLIGRMASQLSVSPRQFREMIQCQISNDDFLRIKGVAPVPAVNSDELPKTSGPAQLG